MSSPLFLIGSDAASNPTEAFVTVVNGAVNDINAAAAELAHPDAYHAVAQPVQAAIEALRTAVARAIIAGYESGDLVFRHPEMAVHGDDEHDSR